MSLAAVMNWIVHNKVGEVIVSRHISLPAWPEIYKGLRLQHGHESRKYQVYNLSATVWVLAKYGVRVSSFCVTVIP